MYIYLFSIRVRSFTRGRIVHWFARVLVHIILPYQVRWKKKKEEERIHNKSAKRRHSRTLVKDVVVQRLKCDNASDIVEC